MSSQHIVIVGGSSGIGLATAQHLLDAGTRVTIMGRSATRLDRAKETLGKRAATAIMDAADPRNVKSTFEAIGAFDHLVLALGSRKGLGPFSAVSIDEVRGSFEEKVFPHFATAQAALPHLAKNGSIIFVAAVSAHAAAPGTAGIGSANAAVAALVPILAAELQPFLTDEQRTPLFAEYAAKTPVGRIGEADDVAQAIAFLIANTFMTGQVIVCDGGVRLAV
jgi:NAD(P)-dependent dehydrogenase (short-subunit alcohol dehydrogenase family)